MMQPSKLTDLLKYQADKYPLERCLTEKKGEKWQSLSTIEVLEKVNALSCALIEQGIGPGDKIGIVSYNCPAWIITDLAILQIGAIDIPMYPNSTTEDYQYIVQHAGIRLVFAGDEAIRKKLDPVKDIAIINFNRDEYDELITHEPAHLEEIKNRASRITPHDTASIIYTSGTTGNPKGVMLTHSNIMSNVVSLSELISEADVRAGDKLLSFLPLSHIFERCGAYVDLYHGVSVYFAESMDTIGENMREVNPHFIRCVPRLLEKIYERIVNKGRELTGIKKALFFWAMGLAEKFDVEDKQSLSYRWSLAIADRLILSKWREAMGGNIKVVVSGAASLRSSLVNIFWAANIPIFEGYGLTETSPAVTMSRPNKVRAGCVGVTLNDVEVRIADDGEILVKGPNVMKGYFNDEKATNEVIKDGWFHTGDIGELVDLGFLKVTDRKKEIFKTSGGKYIAPQPIEVRLKESQYIEQAMVVGEYQKFPAVLISPAMDQLRAYQKRHKISADELLTNPEILQLFQREVDHANLQFARYEQVKEFRLVPGDWTVENGMMTPKLSIKRRVILKKYEDYLLDIYKD